MVRHAEPHRIEAGEGADLAPADPSLTDAGVDQARRMAEWLRTRRVDAVVASPLRRAVETAAPVAEVHGLDLEVLDDLAEYDRDAASYIPVEDLRGTDDPRWLAMVEGRLHDVADGDPGAFRRRVVDGVESVIRAHPGATVVVVSHGGVLNAYLGHVLGIERPLWFEPPYAGVSRVAASRDGIRSILSLNEWRP